MEQNPSSPTKPLPVAKYAIIVAAILVVLLLLLMGGEDETESQAQAPVMTPKVETPAPVVAPEPVMDPEPVLEPEPIVEPVPEPMVEPEPPMPPEPAHPSMEQSDDWLQAEITDMMMGAPVIKLIAPTDKISNFVVFVDNAAKGNVVNAFSPLKEPDTKFKAKRVEGQSYGYVLDPASYERYTPYADMIANMPLEQSLQMFELLEPLIQQSYQELGYSDDAFEQKLIDTIDLLLETPVVEGEIPLVSPSVVFKFVDPALEQLLPIQKLLLRMGPKNQKKVQAALQAFKDAL